MNLNVEVRDDLGAALTARANAQGVSPDRIVRQVLEDAFARELKPPADVGAPVDSRPIWELIVENMKDVPDEVFERLPKDGASQVDHYLYGHPKR